MRARDRKKDRVPSELEIAMSPGSLFVVKKAYLAQVHPSQRGKRIVDVPVGSVLLVIACSQSERAEHHLEERASYQAIVSSCGIVFNDGFDHWCIEAFLESVVTP